MGAFYIAENGFESDNVTGFLKTGLAGLSENDISELENYVYLWNVNRKDWLDPFEKHPRGYEKDVTDDDREALNKLESTRKKIVSILMEFKRNTNDVSGSGISKAVYNMLCRFETEKHIVEYCRRLEDEKDTSSAEKQVRIWEKLMEILDQMAEILDERQVSRKSYFNLFKEIIAGEEISEIPRVLDEVLFGSPEQIRQSSPKVVFMIGAVQGEFPLIPHNTGLFSDAERKLLISMDLPLGDPLELKMVEERYLAYSTDSLAREKLFICYHKMADGEEKEESEIVREVKRIFPEMQEEKRPDTLFLVSSKESAFSLLAESFNKNTSDKATLLKLFSDDEAYSGRIDVLKKVSDNYRESIGTDVANDVLGDSLYLSATQIETFYNCKYRYFCRYIVGAKERKRAEVNAKQYGTILHYIFERHFSGGHESLEHLKKDTHHHIIKYADEKLGGFGSLSGKAK